MKRTELKRRTPLKAEKGLERTTPLKKTNPTRRRRLFVEHFGDIARVRWFQMQECCNCGAWPSECAHVKSRGAGGTADDVLPLCHTCHALQHAQGWDALTIADPAALAAEWDARWLERSGVEP